MSESSEMNKPERRINVLAVKYLVTQPDIVVCIYVSVYQNILEDKYVYCWCRNGTIRTTEQRIPSTSNLVLVAAHTQPRRQHLTADISSPAQTVMPRNPSMRHDSNEQANTETAQLIYLYEIVLEVTSHPESFMHDIEVVGINDKDNPEGLNPPTVFNKGSQT
ncbi:hypothetical protein RRF57_001382 [Xylaria bambusicola]|uniref:Uncharacterized protein n=1 Tax=Xylaria bambusicola TaxID=326684 RepID=A0AAN7UH70_9PEZI